MVNAQNLYASLIRIKSISQNNKLSNPLICSYKIYRQNWRNYSKILVNYRNIHTTRLVFQDKNNIKNDSDKKLNLNDGIINSNNTNTELTNSSGQKPSGIANAKPGIHLIYDIDDAGRTIVPANAPPPPVAVDTELPTPPSRFKSYGIFGIFLICMYGISQILINNDKSKSTPVSSTLYALRRSEKARALLGSHIQFASSYPWIYGKFSYIQGIVDFSFSVKGDIETGNVYFKAVRPTATSNYEVLHYYLQGADGKILDLMDDEFQPNLPERL